MAPKVKKILKYSPQQMKDAIEAVRRGTPVATAARAFGVPRITLWCKIKGKYPENKRMGPATVLTLEEEELIVKWVFQIAKAGFPCTKLQLLDSVELLMKKLNRPNTFTDNRPGRKWYESFLKRHPDISERVSQNLCKSRQIVTENNIRSWFGEIKEYLESENNMDILEDPNRIFNSDETAFFLCPKGSRVLVQKGEKTVYNFTSNDEKECLTTLVTANASGKLAPPMVIYSYQRIPASIANSMPHNWGIGRSESGWMTGETFFEYVSNVFNPWLAKTNIKRPVLLFVDGHVSHLTETLSNFCSENGIILVALYPQSTHILQPMDVSVFHPLKTAWRNGVHQWRIEHNGQKLKKEDFAPLLDKVMKDSVTPTTVKNGFKACGLYPFNPDAIEFEKFMKQSRTSVEKAHDSCVNNTGMGDHVAFLEQKIGSAKIEIFSQSGNTWTGTIEDTNLFYMWKSIKEETVHQNGDNLTPIPSTSTATPSKVPQQHLSSNSQRHSNINSQETVQKNGDNLTPAPSTSKATPSKVPQQHLGSNSQRDSNINSCGQIIPSPFKKALFWPLQSSTPKRRFKEKIPSVVTSDDWKTYHAKKREMKERTQKEKEERKKKREENKKQKAARKSQINHKKRKRYLSEDSSDSSVNVMLESEEEGRDLLNHSSSSTSSNELIHVKVNDYVIVQYEGEFFPGKVLRVKSTAAYVKVMLMSSCGWKWPPVEDKLWYDFKDIFETIGHPIYDSKTHVYHVKEISKYKN